jgi:hypothetical protein
MGYTHEEKVHNPVEADKIYRFVEMDAVYPAGRENGDVHFLKTIIFCDVTQ